MITNEEKALSEGIKYGHKHHGQGSGDEWKAYEQGYIDGCKWKDQEFAAEKQSLIDKACDLYRSDLQQFQNLIGKIRKNAKGMIDIDGSLSDFRKSMEE